MKKDSLIKIRHLSENRKRTKPGDNSRGEVEGLATIAEEKTNE